VKEKERKGARTNNPAQRERKNRALGNPDFLSRRLKEGIHGPRGGGKEPRRKKQSACAARKRKKKIMVLFPSIHVRGKDGDCRVKERRRRRQIKGSNPHCVKVTGEDSSPSPAYNLNSLKEEEYPSSRRRERRKGGKKCQKFERGGIQRGAYLSPESRPRKEGSARPDCGGRKIYVPRWKGGVLHLTLERERDFVFEKKGKRREKRKKGRYPCKS